MDDVRECIEGALNKQPDVYSSTQEFLAANPGYEEKINNSLSPDEKAAVKEYSGYRFTWINSVARGFWDYEKMGRKTPEAEDKIKDTTREIIAATAKAPEIENDFMVFRGTNLDSFRNYEINDISELTKMKGQFMLEQGFTSTAIAKDRNFAERKADDSWIKESNIEIHYHIPAGTKEVIALASSDLSYSPEQTEVLFDHDSLSYITDVSFGEDGRAMIDAVLIPRSVYNTNA